MNDSPGTNDAAERSALEAAEHHHAQLLARLTALVRALVHAVDAGDKTAEFDAHAVLVEWCETELVPHALAEEGPLYGGARQRPEARLLVDGMLAEHQVIVGLVEELRAASGLAAAIAGSSIERIFALHLDKENRLLMPFMVDSPELSLAEALGGLHELVGERDVHGGD